MPDGSMPTSERASTGVSAVVAAFSLTLFAVATVVLFATDGYGFSVESQLPVALVMLEFSAVTLLIAACWLVARYRPHISIALAVAGIGVLVPVWASWPWVPNAFRAAALAAAPLSIPGSAQVALSWQAHRPSKALRIGYLLAGSAGLAHVVGYNPFTDPGCLRTCVDIQPFAEEILDTGSALAIYSFLAVAAACVTGLAVLRAAASRHPTAIVAGVIVALVVFMTAQTLRWDRWGNLQHPKLVVVLPFVGVMLVSVAVLVVVGQTWRTRLSIERLVARLTDDGTGLQALNGIVREVQFAVPPGENWVDSMGRRMVAPGDLDTQVVVSDSSGAVVRLLLAPGSEPVDVIEALTPATRLALKNAQLAAATRTRMAEVQASQKRVVAASDEERRRIERDLHDGAQQRLISAAFQMKLLRASLTTEPAPLTRATELVGEALAHLRRLAHGAFPTVLTAEGLWVALEELIRSTVLPSTLEIVGSDIAIQPETAMAAYAAVVAIIEQVDRQDIEGQVQVSGRRESGVLEISISVRANGDFKARADLVDVADRVGAVGGNLSVESAGGITTVKAMLPCGS